MNPFQKKPPPPLTSVHTDLDVIHAEKIDLELVADLINVYNKALRNRSKRLLWNEGDMDRFLSMARAMLAIDNNRTSPTRSRELTEVERTTFFNSIVGERTAESNDGEHTDTDEPKAKRVSVKA